jgi:hypothetical protein
MLLQNMFFCTNIMHDPYFTEFARRYKFQISEYPLAKVTKAPNVKVG